MMQICRKALPAIALALVVPALAAAEDLTLVSKMTSGKGLSTTSTQYLSASKVRTGDGDMDTIMDFGSGKLVMVNNKKKEYSETTLEEIRAAMQKLEASMAGNPMMEKMMGAVGDVTVQKGNAPRKIAGYDTEHYIITMGENFREEIWAAPALTPPMQYFDARNAMYVAMGPMGKRFQKIGDEMRKIKGFPLATTTSMKMMMVKQDTISEVTEVRKGPIPASAFEVPADYKKVEAPFQKMRK
ncbi:MAG: DUF4412 domain-containing protein, partial [bacterium]